MTVFSRFKLAMNSLELLSDFYRAPINGESANLIIYLAIGEYIAAFFIF